MRNALVLFAFLGSMFANTARAEPAKGASVRDEARSNAFGIGLDAYFDDGEQSIERINSGGGDLVEGRNDIGNEGMVLGAGLAVSLSYMRTIADRVSLGGSLRLLGAYAYELEDRDDDPVEIGKLLELAPAAQYLLPITRDLGVAFVGQLGLAVLLPSSELADRIDTLQAQGFDTSGTPRLGIVSGLSVGTRHAYNDWLALRADLGWLWEKLFLLDASAQSGGLRGEDSWTVEWTRVRLHLGAELMF